MYFRDIILSEFDTFLKDGLDYNELEDKAKRKLDEFYPKAYKAAKEEFMKLPMDYQKGLTVNSNITKPYTLSGDYLCDIFWYDRSEADKYDRVEHDKRIVFATKAMDRARKAIKSVVPDCILRKYGKDNKTIISFGFRIYSKDDIKKVEDYKLPSETEDD